MRKKLTYGDGAPLALSAFACFFSAVAVFSEFIGRAVFNYFFETNRSYILSAGRYMFFQNYGRAVTVFIVSAMFSIILLKARKRKCIGTSECWLVMLTSLSIGAYSIAQLGHELKTGSFLDFAGLNDSELFISLFRYTVEAFTILPAVFLILSSLTMFARLSAETFKVMVEKQLPLAFEVANNEPVVVEGIKSVVEESSFDHEDLTPQTESIKSSSDSILEIIKEEESADESDGDMTSISDTELSDEISREEQTSQVTFESLNKSVAGS